jgi:protein-disulfide isomerase
VVEYADLECHHCALAHLGLRERAVTLVFRHFPVKSKHPRARVLAHAAEAAALQGRFWEMHDLLLTDQAHLDDPHLWERAERLGLDLDRFESDRRSDAVAERVERDFRSGIRAGVTSTPAFFVHEQQGSVATLDPIPYRRVLEKLPPTGGGRKEADEA